MTQWFGPKFATGTPTPLGSGLSKDDIRNFMAFAKSGTNKVAIEQAFQLSGQVSKRLRYGW